MSTQWQTWVVCTSPKYGAQVWHSTRQPLQEHNIYTGIQIPDTGDWFHQKRTCTWLIHKNNKGVQWQVTG